MNTERPLFKNNPKLRQAVNFALDRTAMLRTFPAARRGSRTDSYLPPGMPGYVDVHPYPLEHPDLAKAQALAERAHEKRQGGHVRLRQHRSSVPFRRRRSSRTT